MTAKASGMLARLAAGYMSLIEYFVPEHMRADRNTANQARMFLISHSMGPVLGNAVPLAVLIFNSSIRIDAVVLLLGITMFWVFPFLLKWGVKYEALVLTSVVNLNFCILWSCYFYGGVASPTLPWLLIIPILSLFYVGGERRLQPFLLAISAAAFLLFLVLYGTIPPEPLDMPQAAFQGLGIVSTAAALAYVATMAIYYARIFDAGMALETEVHRRRAKMMELRDAVAVADRAGSAKAELLARMTHELRTPLNAVIGYSQILREDAIDRSNIAMREDVDRILGAGHYLLRLVSMILDLSKLEAGRMQFNAKEHPLEQLLTAAIKAKHAIIEAGGNTATSSIEAGLSQVAVDAVRLAQVLEALIENAAQHTGTGTIQVTARRCELRGEPAYTIAVEDTGKGISPEIIPTLFETFSTTRDASDSRFGGTGLNLAVVQRLCVALGGGISVTSEVGKGSVFTVTLPMGPAKAAPGSEALKVAA